MRKGLGMTGRLAPFDGLPAPTGGGPDGSQGDRPDAAHVAASAARIMGRAGIGADVARRRKEVRAAMAGVGMDGPYWMEAFAAGLSRSGQIEAGDAMAVALTAAWDVCPGPIADAVLRVNAAQRDPFVMDAIRMIGTAAPDVLDRARRARLDSDQMLVRVALLHLFRRDPGSLSDVFTADAAARRLRRTLPDGVQAFVKACIERPEAMAPPDWAWGFAVAMIDGIGRSGIYLPAPNAQTRALCDRLEAEISRTTGAAVGDEAMAHHMIAAGLSTLSRPAQSGQAAQLLTAGFDRAGLRFALVMAHGHGAPVSGDFEGIETRTVPIPADNLAAARAAVARMEEVVAFDRARRVTDALAEMETPEHDA